MVFDIIFLIIFAWAAFKGFTRGFIVQAAALAALILGIYGAMKFSGLTTHLIEKHFNWTNEYMDLIAFFITFIIIVICIHLLARVFEKLVESIALGIVNRIFGVLFNLVKYAFIISVVLVVLNSIHQKAPFLPEKKIAESRLYKPLSMLAPLLFPSLQFYRVPPVNFPKVRPDEIIV